MLHNGKGRDPEDLLHIVGGRPDLDPDCPICKAHGTGGEKILSGGIFGDVFVQMMTMGQMMRCQCPLCTQARENGLAE